MADAFVYEGEVNICEQGSGYHAPEVQLTDRPDPEPAATAGEPADLARELIRRFDARKQSGAWPDDPWPLGRCRITVERLEA